MAPIRYFVKAQGAFDGFGEKSLYDDAGPDSAKPGGNAGAGWIDKLFPFLCPAALGAFGRNSAHKTIPSGQSGDHTEAGQQSDQKHRQVTQLLLLFVVEEFGIGNAEHHFKELGQTADDDHNESGAEQDLGQRKLPGADCRKSAMLESE